MKKILETILIAGLAISSVGCGSNKTNDTITEVESNNTISTEDVETEIYEDASNEAGLSDENSEIYTVILEEAGPEKIKVISLIRDVTGLGLADAKKIADNPQSIVVEGVTLSEAEDIVSQFGELEAMATITSN